MQVDDATWREVLRKAITSDPDYQAGQHKTLVFAKDAKSADELSQHLQIEGVKCVPQVLTLLPACLRTRAHNTERG